jgi:hypothetical protein
MSEENESRPIEARTETEPRPQTEPRPDRERHRRPRRRYPRRRNYNSDYVNSDRDSGFNSDPPTESSSDVQTEVVNTGEGETVGETLERAHTCLDKIDWGIVSLFDINKMRVFVREQTTDLRTILQTL